MSIHKPIEPPQAVYDRLAAKPFDREEVEEFGSVLCALPENAIGLPYMAHIHNKIAARLSVGGEKIPLLTGAEDEADPDEFPELHEPVGI